MNETTTGRPNPALVLATELLGEPVEQWVSRRRELGQSWDLMAEDLATKTNGKCDFSREWLRRHFGHIARGALVIDYDG